MLSIIGKALDALTGFFTGTAGSSGESAAMGIIQLSIVIRRIAEALDEVFRNLRGAWQFARAHVDGAGAAIEYYGTSQEDMWRRLLRVILPHSQAWVIGSLHRWVDHTFLRLTWLRSREWLDTKRDARLGGTFWRDNHLFLHGFRVDGWPSLLRWKQRRVEPQLAQLWALNPRATSLEAAILDKAATYLHSKRGATDLNSLTRMFIDESPLLWRHLERAMVAFLMTKVD